MGSDSNPVDPDLQLAVEQFYYMEARLLDAEERDIRRAAYVRERLS